MAGARRGSVPPRLALRASRQRWIVFSPARFAPLDISRRQHWTQVHAATVELLPDEKSFGRRAADRLRRRIEDSVERTGTWVSPGANTSPPEPEGNTIRNVLSPLCKGLNDAVGRELLTANPAAGIKMPKKAKVREARAPSLDELKKILAKAAPADGETPPDTQEISTLTASLGLRRAEVFGLKWKDVDLDADEKVTDGIYTHISEERVTKAAKQFDPLENVATQ